MQTLVCLKEKRLRFLDTAVKDMPTRLILKIQGMDVVVGLYEGSKSWAKAEAEGLTVKTTADACAEADVIMVLVPDTKQATIYKESIEATS